MVEMTTSGNGVDILTAPGGAGKTYALATAREAWERAGYRVIGAAHTGVAADDLFDKTGIPSTTIARLLIAIHRGEPGGLDARTVLVVEEAGTAGTRDLAAIFAHANQRPRQGRAARRPEAAARDRRRWPVRRADRPATGARAARQPPPTRGMGDERRFDRSATVIPAPPSPPTRPTAGSPSATPPPTPRRCSSRTGGRHSVRRRGRDHARPPPLPGRRTEHPRPAARRARRANSPARSSTSTGFRSRPATR